MMSGPEWTDHINVFTTALHLSPLYFILHDMLHENKSLCHFKLVFLNNAYYNNKNYVNYGKKILVVHGSDTNTHLDIITDENSANYNCNYQTGLS